MGAMKAMPDFNALPMTGEAGNAVAAWLLQAAGAEPSTEQVVASVTATCQDFDAALTPIIGPRGVAALFHRSMHLAAQSQPLLGELQLGPPSGLDLAGLQLRLGQHKPADAAAAAGLFLHTFHHLLGTLIGVPLTERLLRAVWPFTLNSTPQDTKP